MKFRTLIGFLVLLAVALTPILSLFEVVALIQGTLKSQSESLTPLWIKVSRDVAFFFMIIISILWTFRRGWLSMYYAFFLIFAVLMLYAAAVMYFQSPLLAASGIRWMVPLFLVLFLLEAVDGSLLIKIARVLFSLQLLNFSLQIAELFYMSHWFGTNSLGLAARVPGFFLLPNTCAFFVILTLYFVQFFETKNWIRVFAHIVAPISIAMTASGTGFVCYVLFILMIWIPRRWIGIALPFILLIGAALAPWLFSLTGRGDDYAKVSFGGRIQIFLDLLDRATFLPSTFGIGTNSGVLIAKKAGVDLGALIVDSTYASIVANLGYIGLCIFLLIFAVWMICCYRINRIEVYVFTTIFTLFGATALVTETFPANLLFAVLTAYFLSRYVHVSKATAET